MSDPFAPSADPDIPTPSRTDLLPHVHGSVRDQLAAGALDAKHAANEWAGARRIWDERHKEEAERRRAEEAKQSDRTIVESETPSLPEAQDGSSSTRSGFDDFWKRVEDAQPSKPKEDQPVTFSPSADKPDWVDSPDAIHLSLDGEGIAEPSPAAPETDLEESSEKGDQKHPITPRVREEIEGQGKWGVDWPQKTTEHPAKPKGVELSKLIEAFAEDSDAEESDLSSLPNSFGKAGESLLDDSKDLGERLDEVARQLRQPLVPPPSDWAKFTKDPLTGKTTIHREQIEEEFRPDWTEFARQAEERREAEEKRLERAFSNALKQAEFRAEARHGMERFYRHMGFVPLGEEMPSQPPSRGRYFWAEIKKHPGWYIVGVLLTGLPVYIATIWGALTDKKIPEWLEEHGWPRLTTLILGWVAGIAIVALVIVARSAYTALQNSTNDKGNES